MITRVDHVLIGKQVPGSYSTVDALNVGDVALFDENRKLLTSAAGAAEASSIYVGVAQKKVNVTNAEGSVEQKANIQFGNEIKKDSNPSAVIGEYAAPTAEKVDIELSGATIVAGNRYVVKILYKDLGEYKMQFTHTYEVYAEDTTPANLVGAFKKKINAHANRRVDATTSGTKLTLTAKEKDDNEGVDSINEYSVVSMEVSLYETIPGALLANQPAAVAGATITKTVGNPGKGYWKQVRDAEVRNMGYKGHVFTGAYPSIEQNRMVVEGATYDYIVIENDNKYLSNDNQYIKTTPLVTEVYCPSVADSTLATMIKSFIAGEEVA